MWRIPNPNPTESDTFSKIRNPSDTKNPIMTDSKILFWSNSAIIFDWRRDLLLCFLYFLENNLNDVNYSLLVCL